MIKMPEIKLILASMLFVALTLTSGCGGGGGGGDVLGPTPDGTYVVAPSPAAIISNPANTGNNNAVYTYSSTAANVSLTVPVQAGTAVSYLLTVTNRNVVNNYESYLEIEQKKQTIKLAPETSFAASIKPLSAAEARSSVMTMADPEMLRAIAAKGRLKEKLRRDFIESVRQSGGNLRASRSIRANNSGEVLNGIYQIKLIGDASGWGAYQTRSCRLVRISAHCKIFVDQGGYGSYSAPTIAEQDLDHFINEFENHIYNLMTQNYGQVYDIDSDGRLSILLSPVYTAFGYAGLFNSVDMNPANPSNSNQRDLIGLWTPSSGWTGEKWLEATRETIAHEMQHAINFSAKVYPGGVAVSGVSNYDSLLEDVWLDEGLSVGAEARYRILRGVTTTSGKIAGENRFDSWARNPFSVKMTDFSYQNNAFEHYGQKGLFNFYLYEQFGPAKIKDLAQNTRTGLANFNQVFGDGSFDRLVRQWQFATSNEGLRTAEQININSVNNLYRYQADLDLPTNYIPVSFDAAYPRSETAVAGATVYYLVKQPAGTSGSEYSFMIQSDEAESVEISMLRLP